MLPTPPRRPSLWLLVLWAILLEAPLGQAAVTQFFTSFDDPTPPEGTALFERARLEANAGVNASGALRLTAPTNDQRGSIVISSFSRGEVINSFRAQFMVRVGGGSIPPADGFSFCAAADLPAGGFGETGAGTGLIVIFDTWENGGDGAPSIRVVVEGNEVARVAGVPLSTGDSFVPVTIEMAPGGILSVNYRGELILGSVSLGLTSLSAEARWGLGARTGGAFDNHVVDDLEIVANHTPGALKIVQPLKDASVAYGQRARLTVVVEGSAPVTYQWRINGVNVPGETRPEILTFPMNFDLDGSEYEVEAINGLGPAAISSARVHLEQRTLLEIPLESGWNLVANHLLAGSNRVSELWPQAPAGSYFWKYNNASQSWGETEIYHEGEGWVPGTTMLGRGEGGWFFTPEAFTLVSDGMVDQPEDGFAQPGAGCLLAGNDLPVVTDANGLLSHSPIDGTRTFQWRAGAFQVNQFVLGTWEPMEPVIGVGEAAWICLNNSPPLLASSPPFIDVPDEVEVFGGGFGEFFLRVFDPDTPSLELEIFPKSSNPALITEGGITVIGTGEERLVQLVPAPGSFGISEITFTARDPGGLSASDSLRFRVRAAVDAPVIRAFPGGAIAASPGADVELEVVADGMEPLLYVWRRNGVVIRGETNAVLSLRGFQPEDGGSYSVAVYNAFGLVETEAVSVRPLVDSVPLADDWPPPATSILSGSQGVVAGSNVGADLQAGELDHASKPGGSSVWITWRAPGSGVASFSAKGSGFDTLLAVYAGNPLVDSERELIASDEDRGGYLTSAVRFNAQMDRLYHLAIDGFHGRTGDVVVSWILQSTSDRIPLILEHPRSMAVRLSEAAVFSVNGSDLLNRPLSYQWYFNGAPLTNQNGATLVISNVSAGRVGGYTVRVGAGQAAGSAGGLFSTSRVAFLEITTLTNASYRSFVSEDKFEDAVARFSLLAPALNARAALHMSSVSAGTPGSHLFSNAGSVTQDRESFDCDVPLAQSRWLGLNVSGPGTLVVDTGGSAAPTVLTLYTTNGPGLANIEPQGCNVEVAAGMGWALVSIPANEPMIYWVQVDVLNLETNLIHLNWVFLSDPPAGTGERLFAWRSLREPADRSFRLVHDPAQTWTWFFLDLLEGEGSARRSEWQPLGATIEPVGGTWLTVFQPEWTNAVRFFQASNAGVAAQAPR
jgi:hypothetical protein